MAVLSKAKERYNLGDESCYIKKIFKDFFRGKKKKENTRHHTVHLEVLSLNSWVSAENSIKFLKANKWLSVNIKPRMVKRFHLECHLQGLLVAA